MACRLKSTVVITILQGFAALPGDAQLSLFNVGDHAVIRPWDGLRFASFASSAGAGL